jgi:hypothetical protein
MSPLPSAAQGSHSRAAGRVPAARDPASDDAAGHLIAADAEELLVSLGFLLVPGPPADRGPAYLLVAVRPRPTLSHFDPERIVLWQRESSGACRTTLEWPLVCPSPEYAWGTIDIIDRLGAMNRFASFGGSVSVSRDHDVSAVLFRSDAPILSAGGHSGPADPLGIDATAFFAILRAAAGADSHIGALINGCSSVALYSAFVERMLGVVAARLNGPGGARLSSLLHQERGRLQRDATTDQREGENLATLIWPVR